MGVKKPHLIGMVALAFMAGLASTTGSTAASPASSGPHRFHAKPVPPFDKAKLLSVLMVWLQHNAAAPGAVVGIQVGDTAPVVVAAGETDRHRHTPMTTTAAFRIGSVTKTFIGALALKLSHEGKLHLDAPISQWFPHFPNGHAITVRDLLTHRSGLAPLGSDSGAPGPYTVAFDELLGSHQTHVFTPAEIVAFVQNRPLLSPPGTAVHYSNINTILLGIIITKIARTNLATALHRELLDPLGLHETYFYATEHRTPAPVPGVSGQAPNGPVIDESALPDTALFTALGASAAMVSTAPDLFRWLDRYFRPQARGHPDLTHSAFEIGAWGTGLGVEGMANNGFCALYANGCPPHTTFVGVGGTGQVPAGSAIILYDPTYDLSVVALTNSDATYLSDLAIRAAALAILGPAGYDAATSNTAY
jgi:D-alanyl-D-alanine carboxypeptidase